MFYLNLSCRQMDSNVITVGQNGIYSRMFCRYSDELQGTIAHHREQQVICPNYHKHQMEHGMTTIAS